MGDRKISFRAGWIISEVLHYGTAEIRVTLGHRREEADNRQRLTYRDAPEFGFCLIWYKKRGREPNVRKVTEEGISG